VVSSDGTRAVPRPVTVYALEKERALVSSGLAPGDRVVAFGVHMLDPEKPIRAVETRAVVNSK
jgi:multidrug efflux pump subunit AcrA (membrane-fusion protein)